MRWVRTKRRSASWLALAAMALQLILSFGHLHLDLAASHAQTATVAHSKTAVVPTTPAQHPATDSDDYCAICATIHLTSTTFLPDAPQLPVPFVSQALEHFSYAAFVFIAPQRTAFQSRAPPLA
jgi:hypothetical protein